MVARGLIVHLVIELCYLVVQLMLSILLVLVFKNSQILDLVTEISELK